MLWPRAEGVAAALSGAVVRFTQGVHFEVKATRGAPGTPALKQARTGAEDTGNLPIVVWRPPQHGEPRIGEWLAYMSLQDLRTLLAMAGYGGE